MLCPKLTRLVVDVSATNSCALAFPHLLSLVLQADQVLGRVRLNNLTYLEVNMNMEANYFLLPRSVKELVVHVAVKGSFCTDFPVTTASESNSHESLHKLQSLNIAGGEDAVNMADFVSALIKMGSVPELAFINITENLVDTSATDALLNACVAYLGLVLEEITVDLTYRPDDHLNVTQNNGNLQQAASVQSSAFRQLSGLRVARLSRLLLPDISHIGSYLTPQLHTFHVLGAFTEDIQGMTAQHIFHAIPS
ncbi:hypothetical protein HBI39_176480 [Parastagonospora nodorum]|nr:hypothetical protein HBI79_057460 [Parastagonospora nodorum]KAH6293478.1 hypothetical protein HBI39_176480 [Parastagonospora nodorum]